MMLFSRNLSAFYVVASLSAFLAFAQALPFGRSELPRLVVFAMVPRV